MPAQLIYECPVFCPTLERAEKLVPQKFIPCYEWFQANANSLIPRLPHRMDLLQKPATPLPLSRDSGIYVPGATHVSYDGGRRYALSIHSSGVGKYADKRPIPLADGTWILDYAAHEGSDTSQDYNAPLINCLDDGVPVGVMFKGSGGYRVLGLAFVERYNSATRMFTLHGPVSKESEQAGTFCAPGFDDLGEKERQLLVEYDGADERQVITARQVRRERQGKFRDELFAAYDGSCAISGTRVPQVLQAAHINPYRGRRSQVVTNGLLLRADLHLLYDAHLMSVDPNSLTVTLSERLGSTEYGRYAGSQLHEPTRASQRPNRDLLAIHYEQFRQENKVLAV